jgi:hypothetical protein
MALCVVTDANNYLMASSAPVEQCSSWVLISASEYHDLPSLTDVFAMPLASDLGQMWQVAFSLPLVLYMSAWALGVVVRFINSR